MLTVDALSRETMTSKKIYIFKILYITIYIFIPNLPYHNKPSRPTPKCKYGMLSLWLIILKVSKIQNSLNEEQKPKKETYSFKDESKEKSES